MDTEKVTMELLEIIDYVKELELKKNKIERALSPLREEYAEIRYHLCDQVYETVDEKGKLKYSNEDRRQSEVQHRLRTDKRAVELLNEIKQYRDEIEEIITEINRLQDRKLVLLVSMGAPLPQDTMNREEKGRYIG